MKTLKVISILIIIKLDQIKAIYPLNPFSKIKYTETIENVKTNMPIHMPLPVAQDKRLQGIIDYHRCSNPYNEKSRLIRINSLDLKRNGKMILFPVKKSTYNLDLTHSNFMKDIKLGENENKGFIEKIKTYEDLRNLNLYKKGETRERASELPISNIKSKKSQVLNVRNHLHLFGDVQENSKTEAFSARKITFDSCDPTTNKLSSRKTTNENNNESDKGFKAKMVMSPFFTSDVNYNDKETSKQSFNNSKMLKTKREELSRSTINNVNVRPKFSTNSALDVFK